MTATDLYAAMKERFPTAPAICVQTSAQTLDNGEMLAAYSIMIYSTPIGFDPTANVVSHRGYGYTVQEALNSLREVEPFEVEGATVADDTPMVICEHAGHEGCFPRCTHLRRHTITDSCEMGNCEELKIDVRCVPVADGKEG